MPMGCLDHPARQDLQSIELSGLEKRRFYVGATYETNLFKARAKSSDSGPLSEPFIGNFVEIPIRIRTTKACDKGFRQRCEIGAFGTGST